MQLLPRPASHPSSSSDRRVDRRARGFSLLELMVVIAIIAILALIALPGVPDKLIRDRIVESVKLADIVKPPVADDVGGDGQAAGRQRRRRPAGRRQDRQRVHQLGRGRVGRDPGHLRQPRQRRDPGQGAEPASRRDRGRARSFPSPGSAATPSRRTRWSSRASTRRTCRCASCRSTAGPAWPLRRRRDRVRRLRPRQREPALAPARSCSRSP